MVSDQPQVRDVRFNPYLIRQKLPKLDYFQNFVRTNQFPDPVIFFWKHTMCVEMSLIRDHLIIIIVVSA